MYSLIEENKQLLQCFDKVSLRILVSYYIVNELRGKWISDQVRVILH